MKYKTYPREMKDAASRKYKQQACPQQKIQSKRERSWALKIQTRSLGEGSVVRALTILAGDLG